MAARIICGKDSCVKGCVPIELRSTRTTAFVPRASFIILVETQHLQQAADRRIVALNGNNFQASYEGGDGNGLTLTVVP